MKRKNNRIVCPVCGTEYMAGEIYLPNEFVGQPKNIEKSYSEGKVLYYSGHDMNLEESFICDRCNTHFTVKAKVYFETYEEDYSINKEYTTSLNKKSLFLGEE